jgi:hypothetical protein
VTDYFVWTGDLEGPDGTVLGIAFGANYLPAGVNAVSFTFEGRPIGESNLDGPYVIGNVAAYGHFTRDAAAFIDTLGSTRAYQSSQFEGGQITFARLIEEVKALIITGKGGIPRAHGIRTSLLHKAENAEAAADRGSTKAARNLLEAFIAEVGAQSGIHLAVDDATKLIDQAQRLEARL